MEKIAAGINELQRSPIFFTGNPPGILDDFVGNELDPASILVYEFSEVFDVTWTGMDHDPGYQVKAYRASNGMTKSDSIYDATLTKIEKLWPELPWIQIIIKRYSSILTGLTVVIFSMKLITLDQAIQVLAKPGRRPSYLLSCVTRMSTKLLPSGRMRAKGKMPNGCVRHNGMSTLPTLANATLSQWSPLMTKRAFRAMLSLRLFDLSNNDANIRESMAVSFCA